MLETNDLKTEIPTLSELQIIVARHKLDRVIQTILISAEKGNSSVIVDSSVLSDSIIKDLSEKGYLVRKKTSCTFEIIWNEKYIQAYNGISERIDMDSMLNDL